MLPGVPIGLSACVATNRQPLFSTKDTGSDMSDNPKGGGEVLKRRSTEMICREVDGKLVGLDLRASRYFSLNATGTELWRMLEAGSPRDDLAQALAHAHHLDHATAVVHVDDFIDSLQQQDLLE
jgi:coenzyme PQQ synthesis protein D (PqqD)